MRTQSFQCNTCGGVVTTVPFEELHREGGICPGCGSTVRLREITHLVSMALHGKSLPTTEWPPTDRRVYGVSDWYGFAIYLSPVCKYLNTQFDKNEFPNALFLDITNPDAKYFGVADVIICSDVAEHVVPPVQRAFDGLLKMLRPGGTLVFTVPYGLTETIEHFPDLFEWVIGQRNGRQILLNKTKDGRAQEFDELKFHGGGAGVLEMRLFGLKSIFEHLNIAGFEDILVMPNDLPAYGIRLEPWSRAITAKRPMLPKI